MTPAPTPVAGVAMPEWLTRRDMDNGAWTVENGPAERGKAWTEINHRVMRVPFGGDETNRTIRAHEMMHARVSPATPLGIELGISADSLAAAEEFRVNTLIKTAGFDLDTLVDGSERPSGARLAQNDDFRTLVHGVVATAGGKACKDFIAGVRKVNPDLAKTLRELEKSLIKTWNDDGGKRNPDLAARKWGRTSVIDNGDLTGYPKGYGRVTIPLAHRLDALIGSLEAGNDPNDTGEEGDNDGEKPTPDPTLTRDLFAEGSQPWAGPLQFEQLRLNRKVRGAVGRKRIAANTGTNPRRMTRMLTDPQRRVFDRTRRTNGGMVIIDLSGSMALSTQELEAMMEASPGCTIVGYSHTYTGNPNAWVLARDGRRCETLPTETGGNGVDGPIVEWAVANAKPKEPIVWVCDGTVTGRGDICGTNLDIECATLVRRNGIHMVRNVDRGIEAMADLAKGRRLPTTYTGRVRRAAARLGWTR